MISARTWRKIVSKEFHLRTRFPKFQKKKEILVRFSILNFSRPIPSKEFSPPRRISLHRSLPSERRFIKPEGRDCRFGNEPPILHASRGIGRGSQPRFLTFQVIRIFGFSSLFSTRGEFRDEEFRDGSTRFRLSKIVRNDSRGRGGRCVCEKYRSFDAN